MGNREAQAAFKARMKERGLIQINEWIPTSEREAFRLYAQELRAPKGATGDSPNSSEDEITSKATITSKDRGTVTVTKIDGQGSPITTSVRIVEEKRKTPEVILVQVVSEKREPPAIIEFGKNPYLRQDIYPKPVITSEEQEVIDRKDDHKED